MYTIRLQPTPSRPPRLPPSRFSFLYPPVPLVPSLSRSSELSSAATAPAHMLNFPSDEELHLRFLYTVAKVVVVWMLAALCIGLPVLVAGVPSLQSRGSSSMLLAGRYSALDNVSIIRLLRAHDDGLVSSTRARLIVLTVFSIALPLFLLVFVVRREIDLVTKNRRNFVSQTCEGLQMGWLSAKRARGFRGVSESEIRRLFSQWGLARPQQTDAEDSGGGADVERGAREVAIEGVYSVPAGLREIRALDRKRDAVLDRLEEAEVKYLNAWGPGADNDGDDYAEERDDVLGSQGPSRRSLLVGVSCCSPHLHTFFFLFFLSCANLYWRAFSESPNVELCQR
jgi:hypothetical protein